VNPVLLVIAGPNGSGKTWVADAVLDLPRHPEFVDLRVA
jgi:hypothetical protein